MSSAKTWRGFDEKSGDPHRDNLSRTWNRAARRKVSSSIRFSTPGGRRRKKHLKKVEGGHLFDLYKAVFTSMVRKHNEEAPGV